MSHESRSLDLVSSSVVLGPAPAGPTMRDVAAVLFRRQRIMLLVFFTILAGVALGATWAERVLFPARYVAGLKLILKKDRFDAVVTPADRAVPGLSTTVTPQEIQSEIEILKGADVLDRLGRESGVPLERLQRNLTAEPVVAGRSVTNLIAVRYSSPDLNEVSRVLRRLPEIYFEKYLSVNRRPAVLEYFRSQAETFEQQLRDAEADAAEFDKEQPAVAVDGRGQQAQQKLADIEKRRLEADAAIRESESKITELARQQQTLPAFLVPPRRIEEPPEVQRLRAESLDLERQRARCTYIKEIEKLDRHLAELRRAISREMQAMDERTGGEVPSPARASLDAELAQARAALAGIRARRTALLEQERAAREETAAARLIAAENELQRAEMVRHVKAAEESYLLYRRKLTEAQEAENLDQRRVVNVAVAEWPRTPERADRRGLWFYLGIGLIVAFAGGTAAGFATEMLDHSVHTPRQLEALTALDVLACIPESKGAGG